MNLGRYQLLTQQATTPDGEWYRALDTDSEQPVRVLVLWQYRATEPRWQDLARRLRMLTLAQHEAIAAPLDVDLEHDPPYAVFAEPPERTLNHTLPENAAGEPASALRIGCSLCAALAAAHRVGLVHGRLCAAQIWLDAGGEPIIACIEGWQDSAGQDATAADGTDVQSREPAMPGDLDPATDIRDLGGILEEILFTFMLAPSARALSVNQNGCLR